MSILDNAKKHFTSQFNQTLKKITVPEWQTDIYYRQTNSFATESRIIELQQQGKTVEALVESVIAKSLDPEGKPMFNKFDKFTLMNEVDPKVLLKVATVLNSQDEVNMDELKKN